MGREKKGDPTAKVKDHSSHQRYQRSMSAAQKPFSVGGIGTQPTLDDVVRVAHGQLVALDPAGADRVKKLSPPPKQFQAEAWTDASSQQTASGGQLNVPQIRAIVATKLLALMNGRSGVRLQVCEFLSQVRQTNQERHTHLHAPSSTRAHTPMHPCALPYA